ncbi:MAG: hypothetical protein QNK57_04565 [Flavobacteriales bacterium]|tara:strand:+ start:81 stop:494 length:414 start_codon:yes stop_codon:yes gene_type:complete
MISLKNIVAFSLILIISSCTVISTTHSFYHHGTDSIKTNSSFKYVKYNVIGKARTTYYPNKLRPSKQQVPVNNGLIADAKVNLNKLFPLGPNQAYANLTIDVLETTQGTPSSAGGIIVDEITLEAVVSADIVEYEKN